jgi:hypothetical protein
VSSYLWGVKTIRGIIISRWDDRLGVVLEGQHPKGVADNITDDDLLTIFSTHAISEKAGVMAMRIKRLNIVSYYSGLPDSEKTDQFFVALILEPDENPTPLEEGLTEIAKMIIPMVGKPGFDDYFGESFNRISKYVSISEEQRYSFIFRDNNRRLLLEKLCNGPMTKEGLAKWISKEIGEEITDIEGLLGPLRKTDLIEEINISKGKKVQLEFVFLIRDIAVIRTPHVNLFKAAKEGQMAADLRDAYIDQVTNFFKEYRITPQDTIVTANAISDPDTYDIIKVLREEYVTRAELSAKIGREIPNLEKVLKKMAEDHIITAVKDKKDRVWLLLLSDIVFPQFFPEYMVDVIRRRWKEGTIQKEIALKHLELLRAQYIATEAPKFRKKILETIHQIFANAEKLVRKNNFEQSSTMMDQIANYCRDMGERNTGEMVDQAAKGLREDKEKYIEEHWEEDRVKILEMFQEIEERDKAKEAALKGKKGPKKSSKKPEKKKAAKGKQPAPKEKKKSREELEEEEEKAKDAAASAMSEMLAAPVSEAELHVEEDLNRKVKTETAKASFTKREKELKPEEKLAELKETLKRVSQLGDNEKIAAVLGDMVDVYMEMGDRINAGKVKAKQQEILGRALQEKEKKLDTEARSQLKLRNFKQAAQYFGELADIANKLYKIGLSEYQQKEQKYRAAQQECQKQG